MTTVKTSLRHETFCGFPRLLIHQHGVTPSWKRYGAGVRNFEVYGNPGSGVANISADETALADSLLGTKEFTKAVMFGLDREAVTALRDALNVILGEG